MTVPRTHTRSLHGCQFLFGLLVRLVSWLVGLDDFPKMRLKSFFYIVFVSFNFTFIVLFKKKKNRSGFCFSNQKFSGQICLENFYSIYSLSLLILNIVFFFCFLVSRHSRVYFTVLFVIDFEPGTIHKTRFYFKLYLYIFFSLLSFLLELEIKKENYKENIN